MKKKLLWIGVAVALCIVALVVLAVLYVNRNPNVGLLMADHTEETVLAQAMENAGLKLKMSDGEALPDQCAAYVVELGDFGQTEAILQSAGNTPVIFVNRQPRAEDVCYIGGDGLQAGLTQGEVLLAQPGYGDWNEDGVVTCLLVGADMGQPDMLQWQRGVSQALKAKGLEAEFVPYTGAAFSREDAEGLCEQQLSAYGKDLEVVLACFDSATLGAMDAVKEVGRSVGRNLILIGAGHSSELAAAVAEGKLSGYAYIEENALCQAVLSAIEAARVGQKPKSVILEYTPVK